MTYMNPATAPMSNAVHGSIKPAHPLTATKPHKMPLFIRRGSRFFGQTYASVSIVAPPATAESVVATAARGERGVAVAQRAHGDAVEPVPPEPQKHRARGLEHRALHGHRHRHARVEPPDPRSHDDARDQRAQAAGGVHDAGAAVVHRAAAEQSRSRLRGTRPPVRAPRPVRDDGVEHSGDDALYSAYALNKNRSERARDDRRARRRERERVHESRVRARGVAVFRDGIRRAHRESVAGRGERARPRSRCPRRTPIRADEEERRRSAAHVQQVLEQRVLGVADAYATHLQQREPDLHEKHQRRAEEHEQHVLRDDRSDVKKRRSRYKSRTNETREMTARRAGAANGRAGQTGNAPVRSCA